MQSVIRGQRTAALVSLLQDVPRDRDAKAGRLLSKALAGNREPCPLHGAVNNGSCERGKSENSNPTTWDSVSTLGLVEFAPRAVSCPTRKITLCAKTRGVWRIRAKPAACAAVKTMGVGVGTQRGWLRVVDTFRTLEIPPAFLELGVRKPTVSVNP